MSSNVSKTPNSSINIRVRVSDKNKPSLDDTFESPKFEMMKSSDNESCLKESKHILELRRTVDFLNLYRSRKKDFFCKDLVIKAWSDKYRNLLWKIGNEKPKRHPYSYEEYLYLTDQKLKNKYNKRNYEEGIFGRTEDE